MKRIKYLIILILLLTFSKNVYAASFQTKIVGDTKITSGSEFSLTISVSNAQNLWGFKSSINYDSAKIKLVDSTGLNGFTVTVGSNIVVDASSGKNGSVNVAKLTFKATDSFKEGDKVTITIGSAEGSDGENIISGVGSSHTITMTAALSSNNNLTSLSIKPKDISFNKSVKEYTITVENDVTSIDISATKEDSKSKISGTGVKELDLYKNVFNVIVTAENGSKNTYTINVIRKDIEGNIKELSTNNKLKELSIKGYQISFNPSIFEYSILLKDTLKDTDITALVEDESATSTIDFPNTLTNGNNIITISVVSENGKEQKYIINAIKLENDTTEEIEDYDNSLKSIILTSIITLTVIISPLAILIKKRKIILNFK